MENCFRLGFASFVIWTGILTALPAQPNLTRTSSPPPTEAMRSVIGKPATVLINTGKSFDGTILSLTPKEIVLRISRENEISRWRASIVQSIQVGKDTVFVYNKDRDILESKTDPNEIVVVEVIGAGITDDEALKDAFIGAVRQVVGEVIDGETQLHNDDLISEKILTFSRGYVANHQVLRTYAQDGLVMKRIRADVKRTLLRDDLASHRIQMKEFDGKALYYKLLHERAEEKNAKEILRRLFRNFPENVLNIEVPDKPQPVDDTDTDVTLAYDVHIAIDLPKYQRFLDMALPLLERLASRKGNLVLYAKPELAVQKPFLQTFLMDDSLPTSSGLKRAPIVMRVQTRAFRENWWTNDFDANTEMAVLLNTARMRKMRR